MRNAFDHATYVWLAGTYNLRRIAWTPALRAYFKHNFTRLLVDHGGRALGAQGIAGPLLGGVLFILTLIGAAVARSFADLLVAFVLFSPASGAFVSLTQSGLMDAEPGRREQHMARWELAGSAGALAGPVLVIAMLAQAALGVAIRLGAGLAGGAALIRALHHVSGLVLLRASAAVTAVLFPAFLLTGGLAPKLLLLGCLSMATAPWYPVLQAELYGSLPDDSGVVVSLSSAAGLLGGAVPLAVGFLAQRFGLAWALAVPGDRTAAAAHRPAATGRAFPVTGRAHGDAPAVG